ncbi:MAG: hypothetical protein K0R27_295 [Xanthobacteraceae bacterium]|nr:hypothetical protein [Xanthobacteraceae bacterium]
MNKAYGFTITQDDELGFVARSRDLPEVITWAPTREKAEEEAADALEVAIVGLMQEGADVAEPSPLKRGEVPVFPPAQVSAKLAVYRAWRAAGISKSALAARMGRSEVEVRRILDPRHGTKLEQMEEAARALGGRLSISFEDAA